MNKTITFDDNDQDIDYYERAVNYLNLVQSIRDSYPRGSAHGIQKDAIQNGWDARLNKKDKKYIKNNWKFEFELVESKEGDSYLMITDSGTHGLTGNMTAKDIQDIDDDDDLPQEERWARWESLAWNKEGDGDLGSRGQGKMILIDGSEENSIIYESLRENKTYRMGGTQVKRSGCPIFSKTGKEGMDFFSERTGLDSLDKVGTRIMIINPREELKSAIKSGAFLEHIEETWWPIILEYQVEISVRHNDSEHIATVPSFFPISEDSGKTENYKSWYKQNIKISLRRKSYVIKEIGIACTLDRPFAEEHVGVAVFRNGMKVNAVAFPDLQLSENVYGYALFDDDLNDALRAIELPSHYDFKSEGVWKKVVEAIKREMEVFGNKKLGLGIDLKEEEKTKRSNTENKAMHVLRQLTKDWPFATTARGSGGSVPRPCPVPDKDVAIMLRNFNFPNEANIPRLDYDESIENFYATCLNKTNTDLKANLSIMLLSGDRVLKKFVDDEEVFVESGGQLDTEHFELVADRKLFSEPGVYSLLLKLTALDGTRLDHIRRRIWIATDPDLKGPFDVQGTDFSVAAQHIPDISEKMEWFLSPEGDNSYKLYYNYHHPSFLSNESTELSRYQYLSEIFIMGALQLLISDISVQFDEGGLDGNKLPFDPSKLLSADPKEQYLEMTRTISILKADINNVI